MAESLEGVTAHNRLILDAVGEGIYGVDRRGRVTFVNPAASRLSGYTVAELLGQPMHAKLYHSKADGTPYPPRSARPQQP